MTTPDNKDQVQGEGDYDAARRYDKSVEQFAKSGKVEPAAKAAAPKSKEEADELKQAEETGKSHSKGEGEGAMKGSKPKA